MGSLVVGPEGNLRAFYLKFRFSISVRDPIYRLEGNTAMTADAILRYILDLMAIGPEGWSQSERNGNMANTLKRGASTAITIRFDLERRVSVMVDRNPVDLTGVGFFTRWRFRRACSRFRRQVLRREADEKNVEIFETLIADASLTAERNTVMQDALGLKTRWTFVRCEDDARFPEPTYRGWKLKLSTVEDVDAYASWDMPRGVIDVLSGKLPSEFLYDVYAANRGISEVEAFVSVKRNKYEKMRKIILKGMPVYVNQNGGWCVGLSEIGEPVRATDFPGSEPDVKITRWIGGKHYYARVDGVDVMIGGQAKWNTVEAAEAAVRKYLGKGEDDE